MAYSRLLFLSGVIGPATIDNAALDAAVMVVCMTYDAQSGMKTE